MVQFIKTTFIHIVYEGSSYSELSNNTYKVHTNFFKRCIYLEQVVKQLFCRSDCDWVLKPKETSVFRKSES